MEIAALGAVYPRNFRKRVAQMRGHRPQLSKIGQDVESRD